MPRKTLPTGYWTFMCNPRIWEIDRFLRAGIQEDSYRIIPYQQEWFEIGQLGVIRAGIDRRTKAELKGFPRLEAGIYAIVEVISEPSLQIANNLAFYLNPPTKSSAHIPRVQIRLYRNLLTQPILFTGIKNDPFIQEDSYLVKGFQGASMPLHPLSFRRILELSEESPFAF